MAKNTKPVNDLNADDFNNIRKMVRNALLSKDISREEVNTLVTAHRTIQPIFAAAAAYYKAQRDGLDLAEHIAKANKAVNTAVRFIRNEQDETPEYPFN